MSYRPTRPLLNGELCNTWRCEDFSPETTVQDLLDPDTWAHVAERFFREGDEVIVVPKGRPFRAHLYVMATGKTFAKMRLLSVTPLNAGAEAPAAVAVEAELPDDAPVSVEWKGPSLKYCVVRRKDGEKIMTGEAVKADAVKWALDHVTAMAA